MSTDQRCYLARTVSRLRREAGLSQNALALRANLTRQAVNIIEAGQKTDPAWTTVQKLALGLGVPTDVFRDPAQASPGALPRRRGRQRLPPWPRNRHRYLVRYHDARARRREEIFEDCGCFAAASARGRRLERRGMSDVRLVRQARSRRGWIDLEEVPIPPRSGRSARRLQT
jgi:DNA-binding XRE family transcriptional regulator